MHTSHSTGENRLLGYLLEDINKQRLAAGATKTVTPYNSRTAEANVAMQNMPTGSTGTAITDPASASLQRLRQTQEYLTQNPTVDPTGSINTQALAGQKLAESYVAPRNLGNEQYYKDQANFLQGATATYSNQANGFASSVTNKIDTDPNSPTYGQQISGDVQTASMSAIQQSAIDRLRREGKTDEQITTIMNDPVYMENIRTTMSNTGQGGTARQSAVLTPAQAQTILATSRNALERSKAQQFLDAEAEKGVSRTIQVQVGTDKTGQPIYQTRTNPNFEKELEAKKQRMTQEQTNALKVQESMSKMKDFTSGIDTSAFEMTKNQITEAMGMIKNLSPDLQSAVLPALLSLQESNNRINESALQIKSTLPTDKEIEAQYGSFEAYINKMDEKMKTMNEENKQLQLDVAKYNRDALEIDKQIIEHDAYVAEQKQMQANIENEKRLRRQLGKLGITTDVQGLDFLQNEIQKGADAYNDLKKGNNLVSLKAQLAIGQGYALDVRKAISDYDAKDLQITSQTAEALMKVKQSISTAKSDRDKELRSILKDANDKKDENAKEARKYVFDANIKMIEAIAKKEENSKKDAMSTKDKLSYVTSLQSTISQNKVINQAKDVDGFYGALQAGYEGYKGLLADIEAGKVSGKNVSLNPSQSAVITSLAHMLDPNSTVRNDEYERQVLGQSSFNIIGGWLEKLNAGGSGLTQVDITSMKNLADGLHQKWEEKLSAEMQPTIANIQDWNTHYPDAQIKYEQVLPVDRIHLPSQTMQRMTDLANGTDTPVSRSSLNPSSTLTDFFSVYAPSSDSNNPVAYASSVAKDLGVTPNTPIGELVDNIDGFAQAIAKHEGFADGSSRLAVVNNNPGNLKFIGQKGAVMGEKGFAKFNSVADGYTALRNDILAKIGKGNPTIASKPPKTSEPFSLIPKASAAEPQGFTLNADVGPMSPQEVAKRKKEAEFMAKFYPNK